MLIHALDPARLCGFAIGPAGERPNSGVVTLRKADEDRGVGCGNITAYLCDVWRYGKPDLLAYEPPMTIQAWIENAKKTGRWHGGEGIQSASEISGAIMSTCRRFGVPYAHISRGAVMWAVTGRGGWGDPKLNKRKVIEGLVALGMIDATCKDDNLADAVGVHVVASTKFAKAAPRNFGLFSQNSD